MKNGEPIPVAIPSPIGELNLRSREIFRRIVDSYVLNGEPVGSRTLSRLLGQHLSPATIRNVMADLEEAGLLYSPHTSAGRLPTEAGLRLFVHGLLEIGNLADDERLNIESLCAARGRSLAQALEEATAALSGLSHCAGMVVVPKQERPLKHIEFVHLGPGRALVVLVTEDGLVENRVIEVPLGLPPATLVSAGNFLNSRLIGRTIEEARTDIEEEISSHRAQLDELTSKVVSTGLASWAGGDSESALIVRGQANLLEDVTALADLERLRSLFEMLETKETVLRLLDASKKAEGVQIFIGAESHLFGVAGCSVIIAPYQNSREQIVGAIGVIGPTRINYARIIPMVDYTAKVIGRLIG
ncbi:MAG TPA: heat-inducible transcriptional repressor HrcA [Stellaceae bacterium]|jgi:heat-inducible transcriptional repressor|nr:heat-inducible transcriptional repressor HrcA [Stellaceae bacterium]